MTTPPDRPRRRWFHYGEPWGLFAKVNPQATRWGVVWRAVTTALAGDVLYGLVIYFRAEPTSNLPLKLGICTILMSCFGALCEWQVVLDDDEMA